MPVPNIINDGNWNFAFPESVEYEFPFSKVGDNASFLAKLTYSIDKLAYRPFPSMSVQSFTLGRAYLTECGKPKDVGCGIYKATDIYSSLPNRRTEYGSYSYTLQQYATIASTGADPSKYFYDVTWDIDEQSFTLPAFFVFEYFAFQKPVPLLRNRFFQLFGKLYTVNGSPVLGALQVADDSTIKIYGGQIYERMTPYVQVNYSAVPDPSS